MKKIEENLTVEEFNDYCENVANSMEGETYFGQQDEYIPHYENLQRKHIYVNGKEDTDEGHKVVIYKQNYDDTTYTINYDIYEWND